MFKERPQTPQIKISNEGTGVRSILFFLPEKREHAKIVNYLVKVDSSLSGYTIGYVCNEHSKSFYSNSNNMKFITYNDDDLNYFGTIKSVALLDQIKSMQYEALVDLNATFCAATSMLAFELDIPLKIGFNSLIANRTYTITLDRKDDTFLENSFNLIQRLLGLNI